MIGQISRVAMAASLAASLALALATRALAQDGVGPAARAGASPAAASSESPSDAFGTYVPPVIHAKPRTYSLAECLALTDRNHPNIWAARARLAAVHAQLDEARWTPFWQWSATVNAGVIPTLGGTALYSQSNANALSINSFGAGLGPFLQFSISGGVPIYTFGKITSVARAAAANVRVSEWDLEKVRQQSRYDVRRAYYGLMLARDVRYLIEEVKGHLDRGVEGIRAKIAKGDTSVAEWDRLRLEVYREEFAVRVGEVDKGETQAVTGLRFLTGVQTAFDVPDEPLKRPDVPLVAVAQYLAAARLFRPEANMARAGIMARRYWADYQRARFYPDIALGLFGSYSTAPSATMQNNAWIPDGFNRFGYGAALTARWSLDLMPQAARVAQADSQLEEIRAQERTSLGGVAVEVEHAYAAVAEAKNREEAWDRAEHKAKQWIATIQDAIDIGTQDERALPEPLRTYANARSSHLIALMDYNITLSWLALVSGWDSAAPRGT